MKEQIYSCNSLKRQIQLQQEVSRENKYKFQWRRDYLELQRGAQDSWKCIQRMMISLIEQGIFLLVNDLSLKRCTVWHQLEIHHNAYTNQMQHMLDNLQLTLQPFKNSDGIIAHDDIVSIENLLISSRKALQNEWILLEEDKAQTEKELQDFVFSSYRSKLKQESDFKEDSLLLYFLEHLLSEPDSSCFKKLIKQKKVDDRVKYQHSCLKKDALDKTQRSIYQNRTKERREKLLFMKTLNQLDSNDSKEIKVDVDRISTYDDESKKISLISHKILQAQANDKVVDLAVQKKYLDEKESFIELNDAKARVHERYEKLELKKHHQKKVLDKLAELEIKKYKRLKALAESVPYHENIINRKPDIFKTTNARVHGIYQSSGDDENNRSRFCFQQGIAVSFSEKRCFSDYKFKLSHALHEAGIARSHYSRSIVKQLIPREKERTTGIEPF